MSKIYQGMVCKGSVALGTGCRNCERCYDALLELNGSAEAIVSTTVASPKITGLPVAGYRPTQPQWAVDLVNENKILEERVLRQIDKHMALNTAHPDESLNADDTPAVDKRHVALARTAIEDAFMHLNRAVFRPQRIQGDLD